MTTRKIRYTKPLTVVVSVSMLIVLLCLTLVSQSAHASSVVAFKPGRIIDDEIFSQTRKNKEYGKYHNILSHKYNEYFADKMYKNIRTNNSF